MDKQEAIEKIMKWLAFLDVRAYDGKPSSIVLFQDGSGHFRIQGKDIWTSDFRSLEQAANWIEKYAQGEK